MKAMFAVLGVIVAYLLVGALVLTSSKLAVDNANGKVWSQIDAGSQKIGMLEAQVLGAYNQQLAVVRAITDGRKALDAARSEGNLDGAIEAAGALALNVNALAEANPVTDLTPVQVSLMDETSEVFNQINYLRGKLIDAQTNYRMNRVVFFPLAGFFPDIQILGATANPAQPMPTSIFAPAQ